jgi:uncharacterized protein (DUF2141 family)
MNKRVIVFILSTLSLLAHAAVADETSGNLTLQVGGFANDSGQVIANLFREGDDIMKIDKAYLQARATISGNRAQLVFRNLKYGKYAVTAFHDKNGNGILDHNLLHFPAEPLGFSNNFHMGIFTGFPSFEKLQFEFAPGAESVSILVK